MAVLSSTSEPVRLDETLWEIPAEARPDMRVPARVFADRELLDAILVDQSLEQLQNVATLPGIVGAALAMPDIHQGYGFPVGGVAAMELRTASSRRGVSATTSTAASGCWRCPSRRRAGQRREPLVHELFARDPGGHRQARAAAALAAGARRGPADGPRPLVERGVGREEDLVRTESEGCLPGADPAPFPSAPTSAAPDSSARSAPATTSSSCSASTMYSTRRRAAAFGLAEGQVTVLIHSGSRGLGHQVCTDYVRTMLGALAPLRHRPARSPARLRARLLAGGTRLPRRRWRPPPTSPSPTATRWPTPSATAIARVLGPAAAEATRQVYDVAHNVAKVERHGRSRRPRPPQGRDARLPGRLGRAFPPTTARSASRCSSRAAWAPPASSSPASRARWSAPSAPPATARDAPCPAPAPANAIAGAELRRQLEARGIVVRCPSNKGLAEEAPFAYKDVERVVEVVERAGLARRVARLVPIGVVKG